MVYIIIGQAAIIALLIRNRNEWRGAAVEYDEQRRRLRKELEKYRGHCGQPLAEREDKLAKVLALLNNAVAVADKAAKGFRQLKMAEVHTLLRLVDRASLAEEILREIGEDT